MNRIAPSLIIALLLAAAPSPARASQAGLRPAQTVDDFALLDHEGNSRHLYYHTGDDRAKAIVLFVQGNGCPLVQKQIPELNQLRQDYTNVLFWMINANSQDSREEIAREAADYNASLPILIDETQLVAEALKINRTAEAIIIQPGSWNIAYRGPLSDRLSYQTEKPEATREYVRETLDALLAGKTVEPQEIQSPGCKVRILDHDPEQNARISYSKTIAPLLIKNCAECHSEGGIGPFAFSSYRKVQGWAGMIKEVILTRQMPPWQADPHIGEFSNDLSLTTEEQKTLIHWIDASTPRGEGPDPLESFVPTPKGWRLGEPDYVIEIPEQDIPAEGVLPYRYITLESPFDRELWVTGFEVRPGNTRVLHHIIATTLIEVEGQKPRERGLAGYAPGAIPNPFPEGTGLRIRKGSKIRLQLHYTASGRPEKDQSRIGLYYAAEPVKTELHTGLVIDSQFEIPPHDRAFTLGKANKLDRDLLLYSVNPHMHFRGKSMSYEAHYPDGTREILLSVPNYNFNWQRHYEFKEPKRLPKGTRLHVQATWDNSPLNRYNPDPAITVRWGEQSWDEMFFATYSYSHAE